MKALLITLLLVGSLSAAPYIDTKSVLAEVIFLLPTHLISFKDGQRFFRKCRFIFGSFEHER
jgi:F0F1-type ATP synthase alpha subunit